jgi:hypothetical protein
MCGELEDDKQLDEEAVARLLYIARGCGVTQETLAVRSSAPLTGDSGRPAYMSELFRRVLSAAISDLQAIPEGHRAETIANQAIVLARLAGFLAAQTPGEDMTRPLIEAMLDGQDEPRRIFKHMRDHDHGHSHDDDHDHGHGHHHHH